jgi:L-iditol 2-dehydrogenase
MAWPRRLLAPIPDSIADDEAALLEPLGVALHALDLGKIEAGMSVGVFGCGPIGLLTIRVLRRLGVSQILTTDPLASRRDAALAAGASDARESFGDAQWPELDVVIEVSGADGAVHDAVGAVRPGGRIVLVGIPASDTTSFKASTARRKGLTILISRRMRASDLKRAIELATKGDLELRSLITARYPIDGVSAAFDALSRYDGLKLVVEPQK